MIFVDVRGNIGNQLFIYSFARNLQIKTGQKICFNTVYLNKYFPDYKFDLEKFNINWENISIETKKPLPFFMNGYSFPMRIVNKVLSKFPKFKTGFSYALFNVFSRLGIYIWTGETYVNIVNKDRRNYYVSGFWQSEKYFENISHVLKNELQSLSPIKDKNKKLLNIIQRNESICVTVRRGDYFSNKKIRKQYEVYTKNYFVDGVKKIQQKFPNAVVVCFSDDIEWVKENLEFNAKTFYETGNDDVAEKLNLMKNCKHFVISNSSFSWWASYLSDRGGITIAPKHWYADERPVDIYRTSWHYIN